jgi:hypothetical protein
VKINFVSPKGGAGCSTVACAFAIMQAELGWDVDIIDRSPQQDLAAIFGVHASVEPVEIHDRLRLVHGEPNYDRLIVADYGTTSASRLDELVYSNEIDSGKTFMVVRADYLHMRAAPMLHNIVAGVVLVEEPHRAITLKDVEMVTGHNVQATVKHTPQVQRAIDAGILTVRPLSSEFDGLQGIAHYSIHK